MEEILRVAPRDARESVASGRALLVCAYDDDRAFEKMHLEGAIPFRELFARLPALPKDQEIICYCA